MQLTAAAITKNTEFNHARLEDVTKQYFCEIFWRKLRPQGSL